jgi:hypothetical protein
VLLEKWHEQRAAELALVAKVVEPEVVMKSLANKITKLEATYVDLKHKKGQHDCWLSMAIRKAQSA